MALAFNSFGDEAVWGFLVQIFILSAALIAGNVIRRKVRFVRKGLMPSALLGGVVILILRIFKPVNMMINHNAMEIITYHSLALGFIALALKRGKKEKNSSLKVVLETGVLQGAVYSMQAAVGLLITIVLAIVLDGGFFAGGGVILALGFGQGTGQALNYGKIYELQYGFSGGATFGLTIATVGFFVACIVGVTYMNILRRRGKMETAMKRKAAEETLLDYVSENEIPNTESVDKFTINMMLILCVYCIVYLFMRTINVSLIWGFNFLLGTIFAVGFKALIGLLKKYKMMHRELTNDFLLDRISGFFFDIMIIAGVAAIDLTHLSSMWLLIALLCGVGTVVTFAYIRLASRHLYPGYEDEAFFSLFGTLTGTASNGMILLREIDPGYETPASENLVLSGIPAIAFGGGLLVVLGYCPLGFKQAVISCCILMIGFLVFTGIIFRTKLFKNKKK